MSDLRVPDLNHVIVAGRLTRDPELKYATTGTAYCKLGIANVRYYKDKNSGERREDTTFIDATVWGAMAEFVGERLRKGRPVLLEGNLKTNEWDDPATGQRRTKLSINARRVTPLDWDESYGGGGGGQQRPAPQPRQEPQSRQEQPYSSGANYAPREIEEPIPEDDIPF